MPLPSGTKLCRVARCPREPGPRGYCEPHSARTCQCGAKKTPTAARCWDCRIEQQVTRRCKCGERVSSSQSKTCAACRVASPTKIDKARLDYMRAWRKQHPKGPPCVVCGERLSQKSTAKKIDPMCMTCRADTGQLAAGLRATETA